MKNYHLKKLAEAKSRLSDLFQRCLSFFTLLEKIRTNFCAAWPAAALGLFVLLLGTPFPAQAAEKFCSQPPYNGVIDGSRMRAPTQITIDTDCTFKNFPASKPLTTTVNFQTNDPTIYLIIFDNVYYTGNMACANIDHRIWFSNSSYYGSSNACQELFIPVESIDKQVPAGQTTAAVGVPFTYTLTLPSMNLGGGPSPNDLHSITLWDDLTALNVDLTYVDIEAHYVNSNIQVALVPEDDPDALGGIWSPKNLSYKKIPLIRTGQQIEVNITVVLDEDSARNTPGTEFVNTAKWSFGRLIDNVDYEPLPGEWGISQSLTIVGPTDLVVTKTGSATVVNLGQWAEFTIDAWNRGVWAGEAWNVNILDRLPGNPSNRFNGGMCDMVPEVLDVTLAGSTLEEDVDYSVSYAGCELSFTLLEEAGPIGPDEHLVISYRTKVDADSESGAVLTNFAAASQWSNDLDETVGQTFTCPITDGTEDTADCQDAHDLLVVLSGYFFEKTAANPMTGEPVTSALAGEWLQYTLSLRSINEPLSDLRFYDDLGVLNGLPAFEPGTLNIINVPPGAVIQNNPNGGTNNGGILDVRNLSVAAGETIEVVFEVKLTSSLPEDFVVLNQAELFHPSGKIGDSDDPNISGQADPAVDGDEDPTEVLIYFPQPPPPLKETLNTTTTIGEEVSYRITVPGEVSSRPLYDVVISDVLDDNLEYLGITQSGPLVTDNSTAPDLNFSVAQIPAGQQAVIRVRARVKNVIEAQQGIAVNNAASYTYANSPGGTTRPPLISGTVTFSIVEPYISELTKSALPAAPTAGETVRYSLTLTASDSTFSSDVFDVTIIDNLGPGLAYAGNPTVTVGTGAAADNTISAPFITGDGSSIPQVLTWSLDRTNADIDITAGTTVTISYDLRVLDSVLANQTLTNSVIAQWTGIDGPNSYERNGTDGIGELNDYVTEEAEALLTTRGINATITKERISDTYVASDADLRIGDLVEYELRLTVPEGTLGNLQLSDVLPQGLEFEGTVSVNGDNGLAPYGAIAPFSHSAIPEATVTGDPAAATTTVTWDLGSVTNQPNDGLSNDFVITYRARVLNGVFPHSDLFVSLTNTVDMAYDTAAGQVVQTAGDTVAALQPMLTLSKSSNPADGSSVTAGETVTYTVDITNSGNAPAYDVELQDIIPVDMREGGVTMVSTYLVSSPSPGLANLAPVFDQASGLAFWDFDFGSYMIPPGDTLRVVYNVLTDAGLGEGIALTNQAIVNRYYSFDDEAVPTLDSITGVREIYGPTNSASTTLVTSPLPAKILFSPAAPEATIGQEVVYRITVPGTVSENTLYDVVVTDPLDPNLEYLSATVTGIVDGVNNTSSSTLMNIAIREIPAGMQAEIELHTRVRNILSAQQGVAVNNVVTYTFATSQGGTTLPAMNSATVAINIIEPGITAITKSADPATATVGEIVRYSVTLTAGGGSSYSDVFDVTITDRLDLGLVYDGSPAITASSGIGSDNFINPPDYTGDGYNQPQILTWSLSNGNGDIDIPEGTSVTISYNVRVLNNVVTGQTLTNRVSAQWTSIDGGPNAFERTGADGIDGLNDYVTMQASAPISLPQPGVLNKASNQPDAAIGEEFTYIITVPAAPISTDLRDVRVMDNLAASEADLRFVRAEVMPGGSWSGPIVNTGSDTGLVEIVSQDPSNSIDIPAGSQIQIEVTVVLLDTAVNLTPGLSFTNRAWYAYSNGVDILGSDDTTGATSDSMTVAHPVMTMTKSGPVPATMRIGTPADFTLDIQNTGGSDAWNVTVTDWLPDPVPGGMCDAGVNSVSATIYESDGTTLVQSLDAGTHYDMTFSMSGAELRCEFVLTMRPSTVVASGQRLIINYSAELDADNINAGTLTNIAGATQWLSMNPASTVYHTYDAELTDGTLGIVDHQDAYQITVQGAILAVQKTVENLTTDLSGANADPGDKLRYTITIANTTDIPLNNFSLVDDIEGLNGTPMFQPDTIRNVETIPAGAAYTVNGSTLTVSSLNIGANETLTVSFEADLAQVINSGTIVLNQGRLTLSGVEFARTDDPGVIGSENPTETRITSAPLFEVLKTSTILEGDPDILMAGETLQYTITIRNIGTENAVNVMLRDYTPAYTSYVAGSTTLNGVAVPDPAPGVNPLQAGIPVNTPGTAITGDMRADLTPGAVSSATIILRVMVDPDAMDGLIIENQGFVSGSGAGSGPQPEKPSDDPNTPVVDDPTRNIVGNLPLLYAQKTVEKVLTLQGQSSIVDPGDTLRYTIVISNFGAIPATNVVLTDEVPADTVYAEDSLRLNGVWPGSDNGVFPLAAGLQVQSGDNPGAGIISAGRSATITFEVTVDAGVAPETTISNQGTLTSTELEPDQTDSDGVPANGRQPTVIVVGDMQLLSITKDVLVVDGGMAEAGGELEYVIRVTNIGSRPATQVRITDDLNPPLGDQVTYVAGSGTLNGSTAEVIYSDGILAADYAYSYGSMEPGDSAVVRFRVQIDPALTIGTTITNIGEVRWNNGTQSDSASVSLDLGGTPGSVSLNGYVWHDAILDKNLDLGAETRMEGWTVELFRDNQPVASALTDIDGAYHFNNLLPTGNPTLYELRFQAPGAGPSTASMGYADSPFINGPQRISNISASAGQSLQGLNLPLQPNGTIYNSVVRSTVGGARVRLLDAATGTPLPGNCFDDPVQQDQVTSTDGFYKFDLNFSDPATCPAGGVYFIEITPPTTGYMNTMSQIIALDPNNSAATPYSVPDCTGDKVTTTNDYCEADDLATEPPPSIPPTDIQYYLYLRLSNGSMPKESQIFNNFIPVDPELNGAVAITKTSALTEVSRGTLVPYTITVTNVYGAPLYDINIVDRFPAGFKYVQDSARLLKDSARLDNVPPEPLVNGRELVWDFPELEFNQKYTIQLLLVAGSGVSEGEYVNRAQVLNPATGGAISEEATATVLVVPDPDFDCTDVIGKIFDDTNLNGWQDTGEPGLSGVRLVTPRGLIATSDTNGRFHITCAVVPDEDRGSNFILKLDERSLPTGYRLTTENPRVLRATRGKMMRFNFGATIHRIVRIDIADGVFEPDSTELRPQWMSKINQLIDELRKKPSILRFSYLGDVESEGLVQDRLEALKQEIVLRWKQADGGYQLVIETEIFWRRGAPLTGQK